MPPYWGPGPHPRHVPWPGIEPATLWFSGLHSMHWATPARAQKIFLRGTWTPEATIPIWTTTTYLTIQYYCTGKIWMLKKSRDFLLLHCAFLPWSSNPRLCSLLSLVTRLGNCSDDGSLSTWFAYLACAKGSRRKPHSEKWTIVFLNMLNFSTVRVL